MLAAAAWAGREQDALAGWRSRGNAKKDPLEGQVLVTQERQPVSG
jgi:hypothetical protein